MENYKPNSHAYREKQASGSKKVKKIVSAKVKENKIAGIFSTDDLRSIKDYLIQDLLIPTLKNLFVDAVENGVEMLVHGESRRVSKSKNSRRYEPTAYSSFYRSSPIYEEPYERYERKLNPNNVVFETKGKAELALRYLEAEIAEYGFAKLSYFYELVGITGSYTDVDFGWTSLSKARVVRLRSGEYSILFPKPMPID